MCQLLVYYQLFVYFSQKSHLEASDTETAQSKDVNNENLEFMRWSAFCLLFSNAQLRHFQCLNCSKFHTEPSFTQCGRSPREFVLLLIVVQVKIISLVTEVNSEKIANSSSWLSPLWRESRPSYRPSRG